MELGCGCGVPGAVAATYCAPASVVLTDIHQPAIDNCVFNILSNFSDKTPEEQVTDDGGDGGHTFTRVSEFSSTASRVSFHGVEISSSFCNWGDISTYPAPADVLIGVTFSHFLFFMII